MLAKPLHIVIVTLDAHVAGPAERVEARLALDFPGLSVSVHAAASWGENPEMLEACRADIATGDIILCNLLFIEEHVQAILPDLTARRDDCAALILSLIHI